MFTLSNFLSFVRAPLALLFFSKNIPIRIAAIIIAMITDSIDGYFARKNKSTSKFGAILDPVMDKFFVYFVLSVLFVEGNIKLWEALTLLSRDFALCIYGFYLLISKKWSKVVLKAMIWGKVATSMQFVVMIGITLQFRFSWYVYALFIVFGILALIELFQRTKIKKTPS